ncbi:MAG: YlxM family DNA-binding protein [Blautia sp.]|nr:YlxM family DNA-binding protein [Blautia sp.]
MEKFVEQTLLYDFYGELLTERQRQVYESVVLDDCSLSEVAEELSISRQGVHDMIRRCNSILAEYENKLHLVERFVDIRSKIRRISALADDAGIREITAICTEVLEEL